MNRCAGRINLGNRLTHLANGIGVIRCFEDPRARYNNLSASLDHGRDVVGLDAPVDFDEYARFTGIDKLPDLGDFRQHFGNERLPAETGEDRHHQNHIDIGKAASESAHRHIWIDRDRCFGAELANIS